MFGGSEGVLHQGTDRHGAYATGHRGYEGAFGRYLIKLHVTVQSPTTLTGGIGDTRGTYIDDNSPFLHHISGDEVRLADSGNNDVSLPTLLFQGLGMRVTDRHRSVSVLFLHHELSHRLANDIAATENHTFLTGGLNMIMLQKREDAERGSRDKARQADSHTAYIDGMEAIHIFLIVDSHDDLLLIDMLREGELYDEAIDIRIFIEPVDASQKLFLRHVILVTDERRLEATLLTGNDFVLDIRLRTAIVTHEDGC